jgi:hypothetical protein
LVTLFSQEKGKAQEKNNERKTYEGRFQERNTFPLVEESPAHGEEVVNQEETENRPKDQKEGAGEGSYLQNGTEKLFVAVKFKGGYDPERGQERKIGDK